MRSGTTRTRSRTEPVNAWVKIISGVLGLVLVIAAIFTLFNKNELISTSLGARVDTVRDDVDESLRRLDRLEEARLALSYSKGGSDTQTQALAKDLADLRDDTEALRVVMLKASTDQRDELYRALDAVVPTLQEQASAISERLARLEERAGVVATPKAAR